MQQNHLDTAMTALKARHEAARKIQLETTQNLDLPTPPVELMRQVNRADLPPSLKRIALYLLDHRKGVRTDELNKNCSVGNVSDAWRAPQRLAMLSNLNLEINIKVLKSSNRYGAATTMGYLWIRPTEDNKYWKPRKAANEG